MITTSRSAVALLGIMLSAATLSACGSSSASENADTAGGSSSAACDKSDVRFVGQVRDESNPYEASWLDGGDTFAASVGLKQERLTYGGDSAKQQEQISQLLAGDTACLVMNVLPNQDTDTAPIVQKADDAGAFLVTQWNKPADLNVSDYPTWLSHITYDDKASGKQIGDALIEGMGGSGGIIALQGGLDAAAAKARFAGLQESLAANSGVELLDQQTANWDTAEALNVTKTLLTKYGSKVKGIWAANDGMALGALQALKAAGLEGKVAVVGIDAVPDALAAVKDGTMTATISSDGGWLGGIGLAIGYCVATGQLQVDDIADRAWYAKTFLVEKDNVAEFANKAADPADYECANVFNRSQGPIS